MLLALFLIPVKTFARYEIIDEMRYNIIDDYAVLASNTDWKYTGDIVVPQKVTASDGKKYPVTALEEGCFRDCKTVTSVLLPSSITKIGEYCFCGCIHLQRVNIPSSVTSLGKSTFSGCSSLTSIEIPSNVNYLGKSCFDNCSSLTSINIPSSITSLSGGCFQYCFLQHLMLAWSLCKSDKFLLGKMLFFGWDGVNPVKVAIRIVLNLVLTIGCV